MKTGTEIYRSMEGIAVHKCGFDELRITEYGNINIPCPSVTDLYDRLIQQCPKCGEKFELPRIEVADLPNIKESIGFSKIDIQIECWIEDKGKFRRISKEIIEDNL